MSVAIAILTVMLASSTGQLATMPLAGNIVVRSGIGPETLRDVYLPPHYNHMAALPQWFWVTVTLGGILGAALLSGAIVTDATAIAAGTSLQKASESDTAAMFFLIAGAGYLFPLLGSGFFDRYLLPAVPLIAAGVLAGSTRDPKLISVFPPTIKSFSVLTLIGMAIFAVAGTHDYLAWNRARWKAWNELTENQGVNSEEIEGGFEFNGLHFHARRPRAEPAWWFGYGKTTYQIAIGEVPGYRVMKEYGYDRWMPLGLGKIMVLKVAP